MDIAKFPSSTNTYTDGASAPDDPPGWGSSSARVLTSSAALELSYLKEGQSAGPLRENRPSWANSANYSTFYA